MTKGELMAGKDVTKNRIEKIVDFLKTSPWPFKLLGPLVQHFGIKTTVKIIVLLFIGFVIGWGFIRFDFFVPEWMIARYSQHKHLPETSVELSDLNVSTMKSFPRSLEPYRRWLENEAGSEKKLGIIKGFKVCLVASAPQASVVKKFNWKLEATHDDHEISGRFFIATKEDFFKELIPSKITKRDAPSKEAPSIQFEVPRLNKEDKLIAILSIKGKEIEPSGNPERLIISIVE